MARGNPDSKLPLPRVAVGLQGNPVRACGGVFFWITRSEPGPKALPQCACSVPESQPGKPDSRQTKSSVIVPAV